MSCARFGLITVRGLSLFDLAKQPGSLCWFRGLFTIVHFQTLEHQLLVVLLAQVIDLSLLGSGKS
jgi:hypothetical protein